MCNYTTIQRIRQHSQARGTALAILYDLAHYEAGPDGHAWPAYETLAANANVSRRAVAYAVEALEIAGEIFTVRRRGRNRTHQYIVTVGMNGAEIARAVVETLGVDPAEAMQAAREVLNKRGEKLEEGCTFFDPKPEEGCTFFGEKLEADCTRSEILETNNIGRDEKSISGSGGEMKNNDPAASLPPALIDRYRAAYGITAALNDIELAALAKTWEIYESGPTLAALARVEAAVSTKAAAGEPPIHARAKYLRNTAASIQAQSPTYDRFRTTGRRPQTQRRKPHTPPANLRAGETETIDRRRAFVMTYPTAPAPAMAGD